MFKALELENFKAFGKRTRVEFAPITLIYGQNSAGKSSILNALNLLKQTRMSRDQGALLLPRAENGLVDLGSFHELLHDHDLSKTLSIRADMEAPRRRRPKEFDDEPYAIGFEVGFRRQHDQSDVTLAYLQAHGGKGDAAPALRFEPRDASEREQTELRRFAYPYWRGPRRMSQRDIKVASCVRVTDAPSFWTASHAEARKAAPDICRALQAMREEFLGKPSSQMRLFREEELREEHFTGAIAFYSEEFTLEQFIRRRRDAEQGVTIALDGFLPMPARSDAASAFPEVMALRYMRDGHPRPSRWRMFDASEFILDAGRALESELERLFPLGPYRRPPERLYIFTGTTPMDVGYSGNLLPDLLFRKRGLVAETNAWLDRLEIGYHIQIAPVGTPSNDLFEVRLIDTRRANSTSIALPDVGFGISQILPLIVQTLASEDQTITIEQPEVHIHPRLQADLADLLVAGIQPDRGHRFIVETHSEHLILRFLRRIRETTSQTLPEGRPGLSPEQLSVVYLERGSEGTAVHHLRVDGAGEFVDTWPQGFFEERAKELF